MFNTEVILPMPDTKKFPQPATAQLALKQRVQDLDAGGIPKHTEQLRKVIQNLVVRQIAAQPGNDIRLTVAVWVTYRNIRQGVG